MLAEQKKIESNQEDKSDFYKVNFLDKKFNKMLPDQIKVSEWSQQVANLTSEHCTNPATDITT